MGHQRYTETPKNRENLLPPAFPPCYVHTHTVRTFEQDQTRKFVYLQMPGVSSVTMNDSRRESSFAVLLCVSAPAYITFTHASTAGDGERTILRTRLLAHSVARRGAQGQHIHVAHLRMSTD